MLISGKDGQWILQPTFADHTGKQLSVISTYTTMASTHHTTTRLPPELFEEIITQAWNHPMSNDKRIAFMVSSMLVSKSWQHAFQLVAWKNAHIPSRSYISYIHDNHSALNPLCQSVSFTIDANDNLRKRPAVPCYTHDQIEHDNWLVPESAKSDYPIGQALASFTYDCWCERNLLPNLRIVRIHYVDVHAPCNDFFLRLGEFPPRIEELHLTFEFNDSTLLREFPDWSYIFLHDRLRLVGVKKLFVTGGGKRFLEDIKSVCPNLDVLVADGRVMKL
ncbi:hypothetical protein BDN72DRAFT_903574 [Pluteus cervinus]|uniref:Uncharacterized protein n=1 Tax=Pluteus cervinus TaxID=181527 RepID=A0ACD3A8R0_9AGAR|nr:hypothetical protein BDN72DRAFT_903574 [Pluteus cervinus]